MTNTVKIQEDRGIIRVGGNLISVLINRSLSGAALHHNKIGSTT
jgi:hypothetical protein